jgi:integrase
MPKRATPLTAAKVRTAKPGSYVDGDGLMLFVRPNGGRFWLLRYSFSGKRREAGLGRAGEGAGEVTLAVAREKTAEWRRLLKNGTDPLVLRETQEARRQAEAQATATTAVIEAKTFRKVTEHYLAAHEAGWRNTKHRAQWQSTLETYAYPHMGDLPAASVETAHVMAALEPIWRVKPETASRLRGRIEAVLDFAKARGWRSGENPAQWRGHIANMLPKRSKIARVQHHAALPWREISAFLQALDGREANSVAALALRFTILTAARTGEVLGARWSEIDIRDAVWNVPGDRMKAGLEHRVPLSDAAMDMVRKAAALRTSNAVDAYVFPGQLPGRPLSGMAMTMLLRRMERGDLTVHGFRSSFRDWAAEATNFDRETAEAALAHTLRDKVEAAYRRGDLFEKRRRLMDAWAAHCASTVPASPTVTQIRQAVSAA